MTDKKTTIKKIKGCQLTIIDNETLKLAMIPLLGWDKAEVVNSNDLHPVANESVVINLSHNLVPENDNTKVFATAMLWKKIRRKMEQERLISMNKIEYSNTANTVSISLNNGEQKLVKY